MAANDVMREVIRQMREASITSDIDWEPRLSGWAEQLDAELSRPDGGEVAASLTFDAFRAANVARCIKWHPEGIASWSPSDWLTAVAGELGELASLLKMRNRERDGLPGNKFSPTTKQIADELADVLTYLDLLAEVLGVNLGRAAVEKFNEVSERVGFPDRIELTRPAPPAVVDAPIVSPESPYKDVGKGIAWASGNYYGDGSGIPMLHPDPATNTEIVIQSLCARLDVARQALAGAAAMQVVQPALSKIKSNAAWAMSETNPGRVFPRSAKWNPEKYAIEDLVSTGLSIHLPDRPEPQWPADESFQSHRWAGWQVLSFGRSCADAQLQFCLAKYPTPPAAAKGDL